MLFQGDNDYLKIVFNIALPIIKLLLYSDRRQNSPFLVSPVSSDNPFSTFSKYDSKTTPSGDEV